MIQIPDDPIIRCMERTGYPPWFNRATGEENDDIVEEDDYLEPEDS